MNTSKLILCALLLGSSLCAPQAMAQAAPAPLPAGSSLPPNPRQQGCRYAEGVYTCVNFTNDYTTTLTGAGIASNGLAVHVTGPMCQLHHAMNIVAVVCPASFPNRQYPCYEVVEPQTGEVFGPWQQFNTVGPIVPVNIITDILADSGLPASCMNYLQSIIIYPQGAPVPTGNSIVVTQPPPQPGGPPPHAGIPVSQPLPSGR